MKRIWAVIFLGIGLAYSAADPARAEMEGRTELPIRSVTLSNGEVRYAINLTVGSTNILAGLDSGSAGLRILPNVLTAGDSKSTGKHDIYSYNSGAKLSGVVGTALVTIGALSGIAKVQLVQEVGCSDPKPHCAAGAIPIAQYGVQGDGLPGEGFKVILGINMASANIQNPLANIGSNRWIIELPRPGDAHTGRIILNPSDDETRDFINLSSARPNRAQRSNVPDAVPGCLVNDVTHEKICGTVVLDTGAPGIEVIATNTPATSWPNGTSATLFCG